MSELQNLTDRSYKTYLSRLKASQRLAFRNRLWNASLVALSTALVLASVGILVDSNMYGSRGSALLVALSVMDLSASLAVSGLNYGVRSRDMFTNYRRAQRLSVEAENLGFDLAPDPGLVRKLSEQYQELLDESENHSTGDLFRAFKDKSYSAFKYPGILLAAIPVSFLIISLIVMIPFVNWLVGG